ncbi:hypothetical protein CH340_18525 [Rhodoplanes serenus]|nr:hypothetical protein CH340_18525 [Rhodoplanes serenus]
MTMNLLRWNEQGRMSAALVALCASAVLLSSPDSTGPVSYTLGWALLVASLLLPLYSCVRRS